MAFVRFVGCSVGKKICNACDTDFEKAHQWRGGGRFEAVELVSWCNEFKHVCLTGGEPFDQDLYSLTYELIRSRRKVHIETSGTKAIPDDILGERSRFWICVSPKPGYRDDVILLADEVKVIVPGLGSGDGWPTITNALGWANQGMVVFIQPRNAKHKVDEENLALCQQLVLEHPQLRLSVQLHKLLAVR
jgi:organic radical activating enzyme